MTGSRSRQLVPDDQLLLGGLGRSRLGAVPARKEPQSKLRTKLARLRVEKGMTQAELAREIGISTTSLARLERNAVMNPPIGWLANAAIVLGVELEDLIEPWMRDWHGRRR